MFDTKNFDKSKIYFEKSIVFNPKDEKSYLYLAKIFNKNDNDDEEEINLNTVLLLNPQNEEAIYMMALIKINQSDYNKHMIEHDKNELYIKTNDKLKNVKNSKK
jgi:tetratricopeptide (TPR) repeat protein